MLDELNRWPPETPSFTLTEPHRDQEIRQEFPDLKTSAHCPSWRAEKQPRTWSEKESVRDKEAEESSTNASWNRGAEGDAQRDQIVKRKVRQVASAPTETAQRKGDAFGVAELKAVARTRQDRKERDTVREGWPTQVCSCWVTFWHWAAGLASSPRLPCPSGNSHRMRAMPSSQPWVCMRDCGWAVPHRARGRCSARSLTPCSRWTVSTVFEFASKTQGSLTCSGLHFFYPQWCPCP